MTEGVSFVVEEVINVNTDEIPFQHTLKHLDIYVPPSTDGLLRDRAVAYLNDALKVYSSDMEAIKLSPDACIRVWKRERHPT